MPLPFNDHKTKLFNNRNLVISRAASLKRKFLKNSAYREEYTGFMGDMINKGYAEKVEHPDSPASGQVWYIPHFGVYHKTKCKTQSGIRLCGTV